MTYLNPVVAEKGLSESEPRQANTKPAALEASMAGHPSGDYALLTRTASLSATAMPGGGLWENNTETPLNTH